MAATQSLQDVAHLLTPTLYQDATHFVDAQSVATMSHTNKSICAAVRLYLLSYKERVSTAFKAGVGPNCQVHVWRTDMLKQIPVEIAGCSCGNNLVLSTNKNSANFCTWIKIGNWHNTLEPPELVETAEFVKKVYTCGEQIDTHVKKTAYIMIHGWKTVEHFLFKINELDANHPNFLQYLTRIPLAVLTRAPCRADETKLEALRAAGFDTNFVWFLDKRTDVESWRFRMRQRLRTLGYVIANLNSDT